MQPVAVVIPGARFGPHTPTLAYPRFAAESRGYAIRAHEWSDPDRAAELAEPDRQVRVEREIFEAIDGSALVIARSLGSYASALVADRSIPAIWIDPVLDSDAVVAGLRRASAPALLVGGGDDELWDADLARQLSPRILEIAGAGHGLMISGSLAENAAALATLAEAVESFLDDLRD